MIILPIFNPSNYQDESGFITLDYANSNFLSKIESDVAQGLITFDTGLNSLGTVNASNIDCSGLITQQGKIQLTNTADDQNIQIGYNAGANGISNYDICLGNYSGETNQQTQAIAIGYMAGNSDQQTESIACGFRSGLTNLGAYSICLGSNSGNSNMKSNSVAIGYQAGESQMNRYAVAIGSGASQTNAGYSSIGIGYAAGNFNLGQNCIAIGQSCLGNGSSTYNISIGNQNNTTATPGQGSIAIGNNIMSSSSQATNSIALNAGISSMTTVTNSGFYVQPVRNDNTSNTNAIFYNTSTNELTYTTISNLPTVYTYTLNAYNAAGTLITSNICTCKFIVFNNMVTFSLYASTTFINNTSSTSAFILRPSTAISTACLPINTIGYASNAHLLDTTSAQNAGYQYAGLNTTIYINGYNMTGTTEGFVLASPSGNWNTGTYYVFQYGGAYAI